MKAGPLPLTWLARGYGYEVTGADVAAAYTTTLNAAGLNGTATDVRRRIEAIVRNDDGSGFLARVLRAAEQP